MLTCLVTSQAVAIEVVTHPQVVDNFLTKTQLRRIYTMRQLHWSDDTAISVFVLPSQHGLHQRFAKERLQIFPYQLNRIWHKLTYSGLGVAPTVVKSESELIQAVSNTPGAIGYIGSEALKTLNKQQDNNNVAKKTKSQTAHVMVRKEKGSSEGVVNVVKIKD